VQGVGRRVWGLLGEKSRGSSGEGCECGLISRSKPAFGFEVWGLYLRLIDFVHSVTLRRIYFVYSVTLRLIDFVYSVTLRLIDFVYSVTRREVEGVERRGLRVRLDQQVESCFRVWALVHSKT